MCVFMFMRLTLLTTIQHSIHPVCVIYPFGNKVKLCELKDDNNRKRNNRKRLIHYIYEFEKRRLGYRCARKLDFSS